MVVCVCVCVYMIYIYEYAYFFAVEKPRGKQLGASVRACKVLYMGCRKIAALLCREDDRKRGVMFLSLALRDDMERERRAIFRVPGKRVNENFILLTQSAAAVLSHTRARVPPKNVVFVFASLRRHHIIYIYIRTHPRRRRRKTK